VLKVCKGSPRHERSSGCFLAKCLLLLFDVAVSCPEKLPSQINFHCFFINICNVGTRIKDNNKHNKTFLKVLNYPQNHFYVPVIEQLQIKTLKL